MVNFLSTFLLKITILSLHEAQAPNGPFSNNVLIENDNSESPRGASSKMALSISSLSNGLNTTNKQMQQQHQTIKKHGESLQQHTKQLATQSNQLKSQSAQLTAILDHFKIPLPTIGEELMSDVFDPMTQEE